MCVTFEGRSIIECWNCFFVNLLKNLAPSIFSEESALHDEAVERVTWCDTHLCICSPDQPITRINWDGRCHKICIDFVRTGLSFHADMLKKGMFPSIHSHERVHNWQHAIDIFCHSLALLGLHTATGWSSVDSVDLAGKIGRNSPTLSFVFRLAF